MTLRWTGRRISVRPNPGRTAVLALAVIAVGSFALGVAFRPSESPPAAIPVPPTLNLAFQSASPQQLAIYAFLEQQAGQSAELAINA
jgi:hypothetical protein